MNVFVLCTGRCGSHTFIKAAQHITNFTAGHETRVQKIGVERFGYPENHIEADNRLSWLLGRLHQTYGDDAFYVHLFRDPEATARSFTHRFAGQGSIVAAYRDGILMMTKESRLDCCKDYIDTVNANIRHFLADKSNWMPFALENAASDWPVFWERIGARGDYQASLNEWSAQHDASRSALLRTLIMARVHIARSVNVTLGLR